MLKNKIARTKAQLRPFTTEYPNHFVLGGTIAPYHDITQLKPNSWIDKKAKGNPTLQTIDDFKPLFRELFTSLPYVWTYPASATRYDPYNPNIAPKYNKAIAEVLNEIR